MLAKSHDGVFAPQYVTVRHTYQETAERQRQEQAELAAQAEAALAAVTTELQPQPGELFWVACRMRKDSWAHGGWRMIYYEPAKMTSFFAVRLVKARNDLSVAAVEIVRGPAADVDALVRAWKAAHGVAEVELL